MSLAKDWKLFIVYPVSYKLQMPRIKMHHDGTFLFCRLWPSNLHVSVLAHRFARQRKKILSVIPVFCMCFWIKYFKSVKLWQIPTQNSLFVRHCFYGRLQKWEANLKTACEEESYRKLKYYKTANKDTIHVFLHLIFSEIHELNKEISKIHEEVMLDRSEKWHKS